MLEDAGSDLTLLKNCHLTSPQHCSTNIVGRYWNGWTILEWFKRALIVKCDCLNELILTAVYNNIVFMFPKLATGRNTALSMITSVNIKLQVLFHEIVRDLHKFCWWHTGNR